MSENTTTTHNKHLVIGAGFVGLGTAKALTDYGIAYDHVEADQEIGGNWYHGVYPHVHIISSKRTTEFPEYPMPEHYPDFPSAAQILAYLNSYADHFQLRNKIEFNKTVVLAIPTHHERWEVLFADGESRVYKGVLACNGHHWKPRYPEYEGEFTGEFIHSKHYKSEEILKDKRVLVIGGGNSACDIVVDAARVAKKAGISLRRGYWFLPKTILGIPVIEFVRPGIPVWAQRLLIRILLRIAIGKYSDYGLPHPDHKMFERHPTINSLLLYYLKHGVITSYPDIRRFCGKEVEFVDGTTETFDLVAAATGYHVDFPFFPPGLIEVKQAIPQIPLGTFHPKYKGVYIIGWDQARYGAGPLISASGPIVCEVLKAQDKMQRPIGAVLEKLGFGIPQTHLSDPIKTIKECKKHIPLVRRLPSLEKWLFRKQSYQPPSTEQFRLPNKPPPLLRHY